MSIDSGLLDDYIEANLGIVFPAAQLVIRIGGETVHARAYGCPDPERPDEPTTLDTKFDLASVSKLFTVAAFMSLVEDGRTALDQRVCEVLPAFSGARPIEPYPDPKRPGTFVEVVPRTTEQVDAGSVTFRHLLAHNSGLPAWLPFWRMGEGVGPEAVARRRQAVLTTAFAYPTGKRVVYSDVGLMLVGFAIETLSGLSLREAVRARVTAPLSQIASISATPVASVASVASAASVASVASVPFVPPVPVLPSVPSPQSAQSAQSVQSVDYGPLPAQLAAPTEYYPHQGRRMRGEVHDENAWSLGGASGHAGLFAAAPAVAAFGEALRTARLLRPATMREMRRQQAQDGAVRRGVGFVLWSHSFEAASNPLSPLTYGHLGFTGTALWIDPVRALVVACLTNHVYYGRGIPDTLTPFRIGLNRLIADMVQPGCRMP